MLPTEYQCRAALRVLDMIREEAQDVHSLRTAYKNNPTDGVYGSPDLVKGEAILRRCGLLGDRHTVIEPDATAHELLKLPEEDAMVLLVEMLLSREVPPWLLAATAGDWRPEYIPDTAAQRLRSVVADPAKREAFLLSLGRKVDSKRLRDLGLRGERHVVQTCKNYLLGQDRQDLAEQVVRVSALSDQLGYDIVAPDLAGVPVRIEVKTQGGSHGSWRVFMSRGEAERARQDARWVLMVCERLPDRSIRRVGWCNYGTFGAALPRDVGSTPMARWSSAEVRLERHWLRPDLPLRPELFVEREGG